MKRKCSLCGVSYPKEDMEMSTTGKWGCLDCIDEMMGAGEVEEIEADESIDARVVRVTEQIGRWTASEPNVMNLPRESSPSACPHGIRLDVICIDCEEKKGN